MRLTVPLSSRCAALVEGREAQRRVLAQLQLIDVGRRDFDLAAEIVAREHDRQDWSSQS